MRLSLRLAQAFAALAAASAQAVGESWPQEPVGGSSLIKEPVLLVRRLPPASPP